MRERVVRCSSELEPFCSNIPPRIPDVNLNQQCHVPPVFSYEPILRLKYTSYIQELNIIASALALTSYSDG
eukprot:scaffold68937_cov50-Attheya_sp.AAC.2